MITITSRRHPLKFYGIVIFLLLMCLIIGTGILYSNIERIATSGAVTLSEIIFLLMGCGLSIMGIYMAYAYWKNTPKISVSETTLQVGNKVHNMQDIERIKFLGKELFSTILTYPKEATTVYFKTEKEVIIFDEFYANIYAIKAFLEQTVIKKETYNPVRIQSYRLADIQPELEDVFKGSVFTSFRGIFFPGLPIFCIVMLCLRWQELPGYVIAMMGFVIVFMTIVFSLPMYFFGVTEKYLIVKNHNPLWPAKVYRLSDIKEIVLESPPPGSKAANAMIVITKDFKLRKYQAGTLRKTDWHHLMSTLSEKGMKMRNEIL